MILALLLLGYDPTPKIQNPESIIHRFDNLVFKDTKLSIKGLNTFELNRKLVDKNSFQASGYGQWTVTDKKAIAGLKLSMRFK